MLRALLLVAAARAALAGRGKKGGYTVQFLDTEAGANAFLDLVKISPSQYLACSGNHGCYGMHEWLAYQDSVHGSRDKTIEWCAKVGVELCPFVISQGCWKLHNAFIPIARDRGFSLGSRQAPERMRLWGFLFEFLLGFGCNWVQAMIVLVPAALMRDASIIIPGFFKILVDLEILDDSTDEPAIYVRGRLNQKVSAHAQKQVNVTSGVPRLRDARAPRPPFSCVGQPPRRGDVLHLDVHQESRIPPHGGPALRRTRIGFTHMSGLFLGPVHLHDAALYRCRRVINCCESAGLPPPQE